MGWVGQDMVDSVLWKRIAHRAQLFNYLRLTKKPIGVLINFGQSSLQGERYAYFEDTNECVLLDRNMDALYYDV